MFSAPASAERKPSLYLFYGDDGFGMAKSVQTLVDKLGDPDNAALNFTRLDGNIRIEQLRSDAYALPFLCERRLVVVASALSLVKPAKSKNKLIPLFEKLPESTGLVLIVETELVRNDWKDFPKDHWLRVWAKQQPADKAYSKEHALPKQHEMQQLIIAQTRRQNGKDPPECRARAGKSGCTESTISCTGNHQIAHLCQFLP